MNIRIKKTGSLKDGKREISYKVNGMTRTAIIPDTDDVEKAIAKLEKGKAKKKAPKVIEETPEPTK